MEIVIIIVFVAIILILTIYVLVGIYNTHVLKQNFKRCNVIVAGKKGTGKDLLFQIVIRSRKKENYYANIDYGYKYHHIGLKDINIDPNTYVNFIEDKVTKIQKTHKDKEDIYISDGGIFLPSQYDAILYKKFPSFPIYYALSRHLYLQNIHINTQNINRVWKALREQADYYVVCKKVKTFFFFWLKVIYITYDKYESALQNLLPMGNRLFNKFSKAEQDQFKATNGEIKKRYSFILKKNIKYDTRAFANVIFNNIDPKTKQILKSKEPYEDIITYN